MTESFDPKERGDAALSDEAIEWLVLLEYGRATSADHRAFAAWLERSAAHAAAAREAMALWRGVGETATARSFAARERHGPAARFGVLEGDLVRTIEGRPVGNDVAAAQNALDASWREDGELNLSVEREGEEIFITLD